MLLKLQKQPRRKLAMGAAIAFFSLGNIYPAQVHGFYASFDQVFFNQVFWNNLHGRFKVPFLPACLPTSSIVAKFRGVYHRLGQHFTPALLATPYMPVSLPATLTVLQLL